MDAADKTLTRIAKQTGSHCVSISIYTMLSEKSRFTVFLHVAGRCHHGDGPTLDAAVAAAQVDSLRGEAA